MGRTYLSVALLACCAAAAGADQVTLQNGDRLSGKILESNEEALVLETEYAGSVKIKWTAVAAVATDQSMSVGLDNGQMVRGLVNTSGAEFEVQTAETGVVRVPKASVKYLRSSAIQAAYDDIVARYRNPRLTDLWIGAVDFGYATTRGNAETSNLTTAAAADRITGRDKIGVRFTSIYASNSTLGPGVVTANAIRGGASYSLDISPKLFAFASADLEFDEFQALDLRFVPAGGLGYHLVKSERGFVDLLGGISMNREFFSNGINRTSAEAVLGDDISWRLNDRLTLKQKLSIFPNLSDGGEYRINFDLTTITGLWKWLGWQFTVSDRFLSNPVAGRRQNDLLFTTGIRLTFAKPESPSLLGPF